MPLPDVFARDQARRGDDLVRREDRRGVAVLRGRGDERDVEPHGAGLLHPGRDGARDEAAGEGDALAAAHGHSGIASRPCVSGRPQSTLKFWIAWPAAPFTRLSSTPTATSRRFASSTTPRTRHPLLPRVALVGGNDVVTR